MRAPWGTPAGVAALLVALVVPAGASAAPTFSDPDFAYQPVVTGLPRPTAAAWTPDRRMLIATKDGKVFVGTPNGSGLPSLNPNPIIDISSQVNSYSDRGLLGIAVDSAYGANHYVYLLYTHEPGGNSQDTAPKSSQLARWVVNDDNSAALSKVILGTASSGACPQASNTLDCIPSDSSSHSIGTVRADPDGTLWVGSGDASTYGGVDQLAFRTYDQTSYAGKILHIDRDGNGRPSHPFCPSDNDLTHVCAKLFAKGLRNPFRFTLRKNGAGPVVGDVGWNTREELDLLPSVTDTSSPRDFGWPCWEGMIHTPNYSDDPKCTDNGTYHQPVQLPVYDFTHSGGGVAVVGGPTYDGTDFPAGYINTIFFGDYGSGVLRRYDPGSGNVTQFATGANAWVDLEGAPAGLGYAQPGNLIYVSIGNFTDTGGSVGRVYYTKGNHAPVASTAGTSPTAGPIPLTVDFHGEQSSDADDDGLTYNWDYGDGFAGTGSTPSHTYIGPGRYTARLTVDDGRGLSGTATVVIDAGGPAVTIAKPTGGSLYRDGAAVALQGSARDVRGQAIPDSGLSWHVILHHSAHTHDLGFYQGADASFTPLTDHDANSYYDVTLTATDSNGVSGSKTVSVYPQTINLTVASSPAGAPVSYAGVDRTAPFTTVTAVGFRTSVSAAGQFQADGSTYAFSSWSDGGAQLHNITIPAADTTLTAAYSGSGSAVSAPTVGGGGLSTTAPDRTGPAVTFTASAASIRRGRLTGRASDPGGVAKVQAALRPQGSAGAGCRWWSPRLRRPRRSAGSCRRPDWMTATLTRAGGSSRWTVSLGSSPRPGSYVLLLRAFDRLGNVSTKTTDGRSQRTLRVRAAGKARR